MNWSDLTVSANTKLFKQVNVTYSGAIDLYKFDPLTGKSINELYIEKDHVLGHLTRSTISLSGSINSDTFKKKDKKVTKRVKKVVKEIMKIFREKGLMNWIGLERKMMIRIKMRNLVIIALKSLGTFQ
ncbi:MAG: hypothetical protein HC831_13585 [Chloroflexia bacterium]|nr:hypothetical protein [Chloroflexia bacterium]